MQQGFSQRNKSNKSNRFTSSSLHPVLYNGGNINLPHTHNSLICIHSPATLLGTACSYPFAFRTALIVLAVDSGSRDGCSHQTMEPRYSHRLRHLGHAPLVPRALDVPTTLHNKCMALPPCDWLIRHSPQQAAEHMYLRKCPGSVVYV